MTKRLACPKCGDDRIVEWHRVSVRYYIEYYEGEYRGKKFADIEYPDGGHVEWDTGECDSVPYQCRDCLHEAADWKEFLTQDGEEE